MVAMRFELFVALRYLKAKRRQTAISIITVISVVGVAAGVAALVVALAINNGFREELEKKLLGAVADVNLLRAQNDGITNYEALTAKLARTPGVVAAAPALYEEILISSHQRAQGAVLKGVDLAREQRVSGVLRRLKDGKPGDLTEQFPNSDPIVLGAELAKSLGVSTGDRVNVVSPQGALTPFGTVPKYRRFRVVGIFDSGYYDFDSTWAYTNLDAAQRLFDLRNVASVIEFKIRDIYQAESVAAVIRKSAGPGFDTTTWMEQNKSLFRALKLERLVTILTIGLIVLVAALNIFITLVMMVMEKNRDVAVLMSMGAKAKQVARIFTLHGLLIGSSGTALGLALGYGISWAGQHYKLIPLQADVYSLASVPFHPRPWDGLWIGAAALAISFLAALYPARSAAKLEPTEILRYE
jgi:lipoprotein-releasing system permease protein